MKRNNIDIDMNIKKSAERCAEECSICTRVGVLDREKKILHTLKNKL